MPIVKQRFLQALVCRDWVFLGSKMTLVCVTQSISAVVHNHSHPFCGFQARGKDMSFLLYPCHSLDGPHSRLQPGATGGMSPVLTQTHCDGSVVVLTQAAWLVHGHSGPGIGGHAPLGSAAKPYQKGGMNSHVFTQKKTSSFIRTHIQFCSILRHPNQLFKMWLFSHYCNWPL